MDQEKNDELFKNYLEYIDLFVIPDIINNDAANYKTALIDIYRNIEKKNQTPDQRIIDVVTSAHRVALMSTLSSFRELIMNYNHWLLNNYHIEPLNDDESFNDL